MLQNRVNPFGAIIRTSARGLWMGNRGVIHTHDKEITRTFKHKAWITCVLDFKGRHRTVMSPNRWTELFFLDEATAFAAGHRPCFECRREDAKKFKACWIKGNPEYNFTMATSITAFDDVIHRERIADRDSKPTHEGTIQEIAPGTFIKVNDDAFIYHNGMFARWTPSGYDSATTLPTTSAITVLTPRSIVNAFRAGYVPQVALER